MDERVSLLKGVRILDLTRLLPGGYCTLLLADLGADVVKVEAPGRGDPLRDFPGGEVLFAALHRGKRSVALRLKTSAGRQGLLRLAAHADVLLEGFRPGVMERLQLGWEQLHEVNPQLIQCSITGYGLKGPLRDRAGHDLNYLARSGALSLMSRRDGVPAIPAVQVADLGGAVTAAVAVLAALLERQRTGIGRRLDISMTSVVQSWILLPLAAARAGGREITDLTGRLPCYQVYEVRDGFLTVAALEAPFWLNFCQAIGREDLAVRQVDTTAIPEVAEILRSRTRAEWMEHFAGKDVCVEPCLSVNEVLQEGVPDGAPITVDGRWPRSVGSAPKVGEHTSEVLDAAGFSPEEIQVLLKDSDGTGR